MLVCLSSCWVTLWPAMLCTAWFWSGVPHQWIHLSPQGVIPPNFNPPRRGYVYRLAPEAPCKGECRWGPRHFWNCWTRLGYSPVTGPRLKMALCHTRTLVGRMTNTACWCTSPVIGSSVEHCMVLVGCASSLDTPLASGGPSYQVLTLFGGVRFIA